MTHPCHRQPPPSFDAYGSRPRQRSEVNAAPPSSSSPTAAKPALTSRFSFLVPIREPSVS